MSLQVLRTIDKLDRLGLPAVLELLQKPAEEFGADLNPVQAGLIGLFLQTKGATNEATLENLGSFLDHASKVRCRIELMVLLEENNAWDTLLDMPPNEDETWTDGGRPANIGWALDDLLGKLKP